jgi:predicted RNA binding protein YcfA (HicA-like mRNA interferase family)
MKSLSGKELARLVERHGWQLLRVRGSQPIYGKPGSVVRPSIRIHRNSALKAGLLKHLLKMADLEEENIH